MERNLRQNLDYYRNLCKEGGKEDEKAQVLFQMCVQQQVGELR